MIDPRLYPFLLLGLASFAPRAGSALRRAPMAKGRMPSASLFIHDGRRALLTRRDPRLSYPGKVTTPGGYVDPQDESSYQAAIRETKEEIGINVVGDYVWHFHDAESNHDMYTVHVSELSPPDMEISWYAGISKLSSEVTSVFAYGNDYFDRQSALPGYGELHPGLAKFWLKHQDLRRLLR